MSDEANATDETPRASEAEALASLREYALGPISAVFTWSEAATVLDLIEMLTKSGIIEVAIRNPSVAEYMAHWEGRAEKAEAVIEAQSKALAEAREALKPFAEFVPDFFDDGHQDDDIVSITSHHGGLDLTLTVDDFRRAHALVTPTPENPNG